MLTKFGAKNLNPEDRDSSKIISNIEIDKDKEIKKESMLTKAKAEEAENEVVQKDE